MRPNRFHSWNHFRKETVSVSNAGATLQLGSNAVPCLVLKPPQGWSLGTLKKVVGFRF